MEKQGDIFVRKWAEHEKIKPSHKKKNVNIGVKPQSNLCPESEPQGIQIILLVWKEEALLHSLRTWTWTYKC